MRAASESRPSPRLLCGLWHEEAVDQIDEIDPQLGVGERPAALLPLLELRQDERLGEVQFPVPDHLLGQCKHRVGGNRDAGVGGAEPLSQAGKCLFAAATCAGCANP